MGPVRTQYRYTFVTTGLRIVTTISNTLRSAKIAGQVRRPHGPDLSYIIAEKCQTRKRWQRYKNRTDKVELNRLTNLIYDQIREFRLKKAEDYVQIASWSIESRDLVTSITRPSKEGIELYSRPESRSQPWPNVSKTSSALMRPMLISDLITNRSFEGCNSFVTLASILVFSQWATTKWQTSSGN